MQEAGDGLGGLAGPLVEGAGAADPEEVLDLVGNGARHNRDLEAETFCPVQPLALAQTPRIAPVLDVAQHGARLGREAGLHQHLVAAHVEDGVDVLDVDGALLDARPTGGARPQHVLFDHIGNEALGGHTVFLERRGGRRPVLTGPAALGFRRREQLGRGGHQVVA